MTDWDTISFIKSSKLRKSLLISISEKPKTPSELKNEFKVPLSRISNILSNLLEYKLIQNLTPERRKTKFFGITEKGKIMLKEINDN